MTFPIYFLCFIAFLDLFAIGLIIPLLPVHVRAMGASHMYVGLLGSVYAAFQLFSGPLIGSLSDIKGRKIILVTTLLICSMVYASLGYVKSLVGILFIRVLLGLFKQTQMLVRAMVPDFEKNRVKQSEIYGKMAAISGMGITTGPSLGGHIIENYPDTGFTYIANIVGVCYLFMAALTLFSLPNCLPTKEKDERSRSESKSGVQTNCDCGNRCDHGSMCNCNALHHGLRIQIWLSLKQSVLQLSNIDWSLFWDVFLLKALIGFAMGVYYSSYTLNLKTRYGLSPKYIGYIISFQGVIGSLASFLIGSINSLYSSDEDYSQRTFHVFILNNLSILGLILSFNMYLYVFWLIPLATSNAVARLVTLSLVLQRSDGAHHGTLIGASNSVRSMTGIVSPMAAGFIAQYYGVTYCAYVALIATLYGLGMSYRLRSKIKKD